jgi:hypothetical protein
LQKQKPFIEERLESELIWEPPQERRACRIYKAIDGTIDDNDEKQNQLIDWAAPIMIKFREIFSPLIRNIQIGD